MKSNAENSGRKQGTRGGLLMTSCLLLIVPIATLQFMPSPPKVNPLVTPEHTIEANLHVTPEVSRLLRRACADCHSNETRWPWYSRVAPMSWTVADDVNRARRAMNFSEWSTGTGRNPDLAIGTLAAACLDVQNGDMPLKKYLLLHREARVSAAEATMLCAWTTAETARLSGLEPVTETAVTQ
jgi:Haem-binding domain